MHKVAVLLFTAQRGSYAQVIYGVIMSKAFGLVLAAIALSSLTACSTFKTERESTLRERKEGRNPATAGSVVSGEVVLARQALNNAGNVLRGTSKAVNLIGVSEKGRLCELQLSDDRGGYMHLVDDEIRVNDQYKKSGLRIGADSIYNPYYASMNDQGHVERNSIGISSDGLKVIDVSVSSGIDNSRAELRIVLDTVNQLRVNGKPLKDRLVSGYFRYDRGEGADKIKTCTFQLIVTGDELTTTNSVLESLEIGHKF